MKERNFRKLVKLPLLIIALLLFNSCHTCPPLPPEKEFPRPVPPLYPTLTWIDIPGYYGLDDTTTELDDLQEFFDRYEGYVEKVESVLEKYEPDNKE